MFLDLSHHHPSSHMFSMLVPNTAASKLHFFSIIFIISALKVTAVPAPSSPIVPSNYQPCHCIWGPYGSCFFDASTSVSPDFKCSTLCFHCAFRHVDSCHTYEACWSTNFLSQQMCTLLNSTSPLTFDTTKQYTCSTFGDITSCVSVQGLTTLGNIDC